MALTYAANGRTLVMRAPSGEERLVMSTLVAAGITITVRSDRYRRWPETVVLDDEHLGTLLAAESCGTRHTWVQDPVRAEVVPPPMKPGWYADGHPLEESTRERLEALGAVPVGSLRLPADAEVHIGPGTKTRGRAGRVQRYWLRYRVPSGGE